LAQRESSGSQSAIDPTAEQDSCLTFTSGRVGLAQEKFIEKFGLSWNITQDTPLYSSTYDLNGDGVNEYFFYFDSNLFCGAQTGCSILMYQVDYSMFRRISKYGIPTFGKFYPDVNVNTRFICAIKTLTNGWRDLEIDRVGKMVFDGEAYN
jgi:hypothetical protein